MMRNLVLLEFIVSLFVIVLSLASSGTEAWMTTTTKMIRPSLVATKTRSFSSRINRNGLCAKLYDEDQEQYDKIQRRSVPSSDDDDSLSRRTLLLRSFGSLVIFAATGTMTTKVSVANANDQEDPLAQMDAIAAQIGGSSSSSNYPNSISPLPTMKQSAQELTSDSSTDGGQGASPSPVAATPSSDLDKALKESNQRKKIGPLTHG